ncbi:hypothetical protein ACFLS4_06540, partial [Bacteroidota bacterium]
MLTNLYSRSFNYQEIAAIFRIDFEEFIKILKEKKPELENESSALNSIISESEYVEIAKFFISKKKLRSKYKKPNDREKIGIVEWFDKSKGFGIIKSLVDEYFIHITNIKDFFILNEH